MPDNRTHEALVDHQFGSRAAAYLTSTPHARGADLVALAAIVEGQGQARVLDLGCGAGHVSFQVAPRVKEVVAYDLSPDMLTVVSQAAAQKGLANITTKQGVAEQLPFPDASFDYVLSRYSAHHWRDFEAGLREVHRVLRPGGIAGIVDAISPGTPLLDTYLQATELLRDASHVRNRSRGEWEAALTRAGLISGSVAAFHVRLEFGAWVERMRTPKVHVDAIRSLQAAMAGSVARYFGIGEDGSFDLDVALFVASKSP
jgi:SAM-dependent methyltransferase